MHTCTTTKCSMGIGHNMYQYLVVFLVNDVVLARIDDEPSFESPSYDILKKLVA